MHQLEIGDILVLRKQHPCGSKKWEVWKIGMDIGIRCLGCDRKVRILRTKLEKQIKVNYPTDFTRKTRENQMGACEGTCKPG